jgi:hypothetical protein
VAHLVASVLPGVLAWVVLAGYEAAADGGAASISLTTGTIAALGIVSVLSWTATVPLPRLTGGILWLLMFVAPVGSRPSGLLRCERWCFRGRSSAAASFRSVLFLAVVAAASLRGVAIALGWICRTDVTLQVAR